MNHHYKLVNYSMKKHLLYSLLILAFIGQSCAQKPGNDSPIVEPKVFLKNFMSYWKYSTQQLIFTDDFNCYAVTGEPISKSSFLAKYASGDYIPVRLQTKGGKAAYRLYKVSASNVNADILQTIKQSGSFAYNEYLQLGKPLTGFNFTDLNGKVYTTAMLKGKIVALKFWFINCHACNNEMPELNKVVEQYKNRKDILFLSLATDSPKELKVFLKKTKFNYAVISEQNDYMTKQFKTNVYPTHVLIDKKGIVQLVTSDSKILTEKLKKEAI
jgi:peroxiredoxin